MWKHNFISYLGWNMSIWKHVQVTLQPKNLTKLFCIKKMYCFYIVTLFSCPLNLLNPRILIKKTHNAKDPLQIIPFFFMQNLLFVPFFLGWNISICKQHVQVSTTQKSEEEFFFFFTTTFFLCIISFHVS